MKRFHPDSRSDKVAVSAVISKISGTRYSLNKEIFVNDITGGICILNRKVFHALNSRILGISAKAIRGFKDFLAIQSGQRLLLYTASFSLLRTLILKEDKKVEISEDCSLLFQGASY